ncbi:murein biosynthesis integral membrane protein MurJ [Calothrix sp. UHCC 0171]|uniref:murein biosynthesis integral membrane protein MurJ n=1 Tax=Calothrix sp. UHCC 0171 TaxID=3110245 RepID=UPI002B1FA4A1|nr:murein biosynthesis integral membrane protein MurJ [Calothrix sp. UHCC 0171]MEA5571827.1 murein biosynthesis integral membrane protein MurJ [Calothrix sp. UHCC 0171]
MNKNFSIKQFGKLWQQFTKGSINRQILSAAIIVGLCTMLVKVVAFSKESIVAWKFGTNDLVDAFLIASVIPNFIVNVIAGSLNAALIPTYIQVREQEGFKESEKLLSGAILCSLTLLGITTLFIIITAPIYIPWMTLGFSPEKLALTYQLFYMTTPVILFTGIIMLLSAVLNAGEKFAIAAISPLLSPGVTILLLLLFEQSLGIFALAIGLVLGVVLEVIVLGVVLHRRGIVLRPKWFGLSAAFQQVVKQYAPAMMGALLMCSTALVDQSMAAMLAPGSVAALNYASRVSSFPILLGSTAISTAAIPYLSKMVASSDWQGVKHTLRSYIQLIFLITIPLTGLLILLSKPIIQILFQRGAFTAQETNLVAHILSAYALQIPFYIALIFIVKLLTSLCLNSILMWVSVYNLIINIALNYLFMKWVGIQGIALSTSCVILFSFVFLLVASIRHLRKMIFANSI